MSRRKQQKAETTAQRNPWTDENSSLSKLYSQLTDPHMYNTIMHGSQSVRRKLLSIDYNVLRRTVHKIPLINAIINTRIDQILPFCKWVREDGERGFDIVLNDRYHDKDKEDEDEIRALVEFIEQSGFSYDPDREDDFMDYVQMVVRELLTIDQIATEIQPNRKGEASAFWLLDGATIYRVAEDSDYKRGVRFIQEIEGKKYSEYSDNLIFDYRYKRADIRHRGYGYSPVEQAIDIITTLLFGYNYTRDQLIRDRVPKGFLAVMGDVGNAQMTAIQNYWYAAMSGVGGKWNIPILPSGKDGVGMEFKSLNQSNKDMEYGKLMQLTTTVICAVYGIDVAEMGLQMEQSQSIIHNDSSEPRIKQSRNRGLEALLSFIEQHMNKIMRKVTDKYVFRFKGVRIEDESRTEDIKSKKLGNRYTINQLREEEGLDPLEDDYANVVLNPQAVQIYMADKQQAQAAEQQAQAAEMENDFDDDFENIPDEDEGDEAQDNEAPQATETEGEEVQKSVRREQLRKSSTQRKAKVVKYVIE